MLPLYERCLFQFTLSYGCWLPIQRIWMMWCNQITIKLTISCFVFIFFFRSFDCDEIKFNTTNVVNIKDCYLCTFWDRRQNLWQTKNVKRCVKMCESIMCAAIYYGKHSILFRDNQRQISTIKCIGKSDWRWQGPCQPYFDWFVCIQIGIKYVWEII